MLAMLVVSDASPIRALEWVGLVQILNSLFDRVVVPPAVAAELERRNGPYRRIELSRLDFIHVTHPQNPEIVQELSHILDPGESEALALASEVPDSLLLIDEKAGRRQAHKMNLDSSTNEVRECARARIGVFRDQRVVFCDSPRSGLRN